MSKMLGTKLNKKFLINFCKQNNFGIALQFTDIYNHNLANHQIFQTQKSSKVQN